LGRRRRAGFTLVEVIVVLVILAILAAIAIPALTGYIDKAQDKQYIMQARELAIATRTVLDEAYANGELNTPAASVFLNGGTPGPAYRQYSMTELYNASIITGASYNNRVAALADRTYAGGLNVVGAYRLFLEGPADGNILDADGFYYYLAPEGKWGVPGVIVTYRMTHVENVEGELDLTSSMQYSASAGYEIYHIS
jgi:prepilin-type N-terminal cleavage/methylation domain-containing protein